MPAWLFLGALNGLIAVAAGAYGRHGGLTPEGREMFQIAGQFQLAHALALLAVAWLAERAANAGGGRGLPRLAGAAFVLGIGLFCGTLYWFGLTGVVPVLGAAPAGGFCLMLGWVLLMAEAGRLAWRQR